MNKHDKLARDKFLTYVAQMVNYWEEKGTSRRDALEGLAFSLLVGIDGDSINLGEEYVLAPVKTAGVDTARGNIAGELHEHLTDFLKK